MDTQVLEFQQWMNTTYKNHREWKGSPEDGKHGGKTVFSMIQALQAEIGYDNLSGNFGSGTLASVPLMKIGRNFDNFTVILKGSLWRAGYAAGHIFSEINEDTVNAIKKIQKDIGIQQNGQVDGYLWKALMTTDGYVTTWSGGSETLRKAQQELNKITVYGYNFAKDYLAGYLPCDGLGGRKLSTSIIKLIQARLGYSPSTATGNLGPATQSALPNLDNQTSFFTKIARIALLANTYNLDSTSEEWSSDLTLALKQFQSDMNLVTNGKLNFETWMALLISYGDKNRPFKGIDTRFELTQERIDVIKGMGVEIVGRYINGTDFKVLRTDEPRRIIDNNLKLIPIYQESGDSINYFNYELGVYQGKNATHQLLKFGIPYGSTVYFAVDFDAQQHEIISNIIPYFKGVKSEMKGFSVGVYGTRNVCEMVIKNGYAKLAFVSNMSSGYSGNLGFKMPNQWAFDQFDEISIDDWGIDKLSVSGKDSGVTYLVPPIETEHPPLPEPPNTDYELPAVEINTNFVRMQDVINDVIEMENYYLILNPTSTKEVVMEEILNVLRYKQYSGLKWDLMLDRGKGEFYEQLKQNKPVLFGRMIEYTSSSTQLYDSIEGEKVPIKLGHLAATLLGYIHSVFSSSWTGWVGDLSSAYSDVRDNKLIGESNLDTANRLIGSSNSRCNYTDIIVDIDAAQIYTYLPIYSAVTDKNLLSSILISYYQKTEKKGRYAFFINTIVESRSDSLSDIYNGIASTFAIEGGFYAVTLLNTVLWYDEEIILSLLAAMANYIYERYKLEKE